MQQKPPYSDIVDINMFVRGAPGELVVIKGTDPIIGHWEHRAFIPHPLTNTMPPLTGRTIIAVGNARAALAALDSTARQLPNPMLLRLPTLRLEAQTTSSLEGTYAPLAEVLVADEDSPATPELSEILNYVRAANHGFASISEGRPITAGLLEDLQGLLMRNSALGEDSGQLRTTQVVIGRRAEVPASAPAVQRSRFVPPPPGSDLASGVQQLVDWMRSDHKDGIDPVVAAAMAHYQFETLHPFRDGNGRIGRLLIVLYLQSVGVLTEPTLTVSPWFESRRSEYFSHLLAVSTQNNWDDYIHFFANGLRHSADSTLNEILELSQVQADLKNVIRSSPLRADSAHALVDIAVAQPNFTVRMVEEQLGISYTRANTLVQQLVGLGVLAVVDPNVYKRRYYAPRVIEALTSRPTP